MKTKLTLTETHSEQYHIYKGTIQNDDGKSDASKKIGRAFRIESEKGRARYKAEGTNKETGEQEPKKHIQNNRHTHTHTP